MLQNKAILDNARKFNATKEGTEEHVNPDAAKFIADMFPGGDRSSIIDEIMGISRYEANTA